MQITNPANHFNIDYDNSALYSELFKLGILQSLLFLITIKLLWLKAGNLLNKANGGSTQITSRVGLMYR